MQSLYGHRSASGVTSRARGSNAAWCRAFLQPRSNAASSDAQGMQQSLSQTAVSLLLSLSLTLGPGLLAAEPATASQVRLEDVENPRIQEGLIAATQGEFNRAETIFRSLLKDDASSYNSASTWSNLGNVHMSLGRADEAVDDYDQAVRLAPQAPVPYLNRAIALEQLGLDLDSQGSKEAAQAKWQAAVQDCNAAIELDPTEYAAWFNRGNVEMRLQQYEAAEESFRQAADLAPGISGYRLRQAQLEFQNGKTDVAARLTKSVCRRNPNYAEAYASLAAMLYQQGQVAQAEGAYNTATQIEPSFRYMDFVTQNTRWPPRLYATFSQFLSLGAVEP